VKQIIKKNLKLGGHNMPKRSKEQIDIDEKKILDELRNNGKKSINEIAESLGFSRQKVWRVIKNLEKNKTVWGYTTIIDFEKQGLKSYTLLVKRTMTPLNDKIGELIISGELSNIGPKMGVCIVDSKYVHGEYDWIISFTAEDIKQAKKMQEAINTMYHKYIDRVTLLEDLFVTRDHGILNPNFKDIKKFI
jgi:DNA-binding Lrp family transcriptional regulator